MPRKPLLVHSEMVNICCQLFPILIQIDLVQCFLSQNIYTISFFVNILLNVFSYVAIHVALYITTKSRSNKAISSSYISLFYCADASFTNFFVISGKVSICHRRWFCFYRYIVSQPLKTWKKGRALADITPQFDAPLPEPYP